MPASPTPPPTALPPDELNSLLRRFNHEVHQIEHDPSLTPDQLDFDCIPSREFRPDVLRSNLERLHLNLGQRALGAVAELNRLRKWEDPVRSSTYGLAYFLAWNSWVGAGPAGLLFVGALVLSPEFRQFAFPPRIPTRPDTGLVDIPGSGAEPEQAESEAQQFADDLAQLAAAAATPHPDPPETEPSRSPGLDESLSPIDAALDNDLEQKVKVTRLAKIGLPLQALSGDLADGWERWLNALSPKPPFPQHQARIKLALYLLAIAIALAIVPPRLLQKGFMAALGLGFFGGPAIERGLGLLDRSHPRWKEQLELRNSVLKGVPSNTQLTITLLRAGERAGKPLPPAMPLRSPPVSRAASGPILGAVPERAGSLDSLAVVESKEPVVKAKKSKFKFADLVKGAALVTEHAAGIAAGHK